MREFVHGSVRLGIRAPCNTNERLVFPYVFLYVFVLFFWWLVHEASPRRVGLLLNPRRFPKATESPSGCDRIRMGIRTLLDILIGFAMRFMRAGDLRFLMWFGGCFFGWPVHEP